MKYPVLREGVGLRTLPEIVLRGAELFKDKVALQLKLKDGSWNRYTYRQLLISVKRVANFLKSKGYKKGDFISIIGENRPEWMIAYFAIMWIGGVAVPLDSRAKEVELTHIIKHSGVKCVISSEKYIENFVDMPLKDLVSMDEFPQIYEKYSEEISLADIKLNDLAVVLYTSGTTGSSKGVMLTHKNISANVHSLTQCLPLDKDDRIVSFLPIHHVYENTAGNLVPLSLGVTITYARSIKPKLLFEDFREIRPTLMLTVPLFLEKILFGIYKQIQQLSPVKKVLFYSMKSFAKVINKIKSGLGSKIAFKSIREKLGLDKLKYLISGGAALPRWVSKGLEELGFPILQGYGLSETAPVVTLNPPQKPKNESVGLPIPDVEIKIVYPNQEGIGEIAVKGPNVMLGYFKNPEATKEVFTPDGWLLTGDLGYIDEEGYLYITGRKKSVIVTKGGKNIYPEEIENVLIQSPFIEEVLVVKRINPKTKDEEVHAIIYPNFEEFDNYFAEQGIVNPTNEDIKKVLQKEIDNLCKQLADYKRVRTFSIRDEEFPKTTTRKIKRYLFEEGMG